jgi:hypothetical protein
MIQDYGRKRQRVIEAICEEWGFAETYGKGTLDSEVVYNRLLLLGEGNGFEKGDMNAILTALRMTRLINGLRAQDRGEREAIERHGGMIITGVASRLCQGYRRQERR